MNKPIVHYRGEAQPYYANTAILVPLDHPNHKPGHSISNNHIARTSSIVNWNHETGRIETLNTIYVPEEPSSTPKE